MNTTAETRVPSPEMEAATEAPAANLPKTFGTGDGGGPQTFPQPPSVPTPAPSGFGEVVAAVAAVMADLTPVGKSGTNTFHNYKYARMQDILQILTPLMGRHGLAVFQYEGDRNMFDDGKVIAITYRFIVAHKSGQTWVNPVPQTGMSPCRTSKGTFDDKAMAKCHTSARKYFLLSLFQIPTEDEADPDNQKRERAAAPVPSPDGHVKPHLIEPMERDTFEAWAGRYRAAFRTAKTDAELVLWDQLNDGPLSQMNDNEKGAPVYAGILKEFEAFRVKMQAAPADAGKKADPISTGISDEEKAARAAALVEDRARENATASAPAATGQFVRPAGMPNAEMEPDNFVAWAIKRMDNITDGAALTVVWENEISAGSDGLFKPDVDALQAHYEARLAKLEG